MSFYGIVTMIVVMMPEGSIARNQKVVVIVLLLLTLPFTLLVGFLAARRSKKKAKKAAEEAEKKAEAPADGAAAPAKLAAPSGNYNDLATSTEEVVQFLKTSNLGAGGKDAVYSLPWYMVAGSPRAGKSSLVIGSNLNFQNLPSQRQSEQKFVKPTSNIDWRVTSDAVFIDTAGRYQTEGVDGDEWSALVENIKKYRANRPLDGFLLVVDASEVLGNDERQNEELAKVLRARLDDAMQRLKVRFPVYLVFTHADSIEGFRDSFSSSKSEDKTLVWGATIPIEKSENAQAMFDGEFEILHNSVMKRRLTRLSAPFPPVRQLRIFNFPLHFGSSRRKFAAFVNALFRPNPFSENPFLRGFYFTAAPEAKAGQGIPRTVGNSYFVERFFRDVVLRDKDLVRTMLAQRQRPPIFGWFMTFLAAFIVIGLLAMAGVSLISNRQMLDESVAVGQKALDLRNADTGKDVLNKNEDEVRSEMRVLEDMRPLLTRLDNYDREGAPLYMRFGMYSGSNIYENNLLPLYFNLVEARFKEPAKRRMEAELRKFADGKSVVNAAGLTEEEKLYLEKHYNMLKAYLMLSGQFAEKAEASHIANTLSEIWADESKIPSDMRPTALAHLEFWAKQVDRDQYSGNFPRIDLNDQRIAKLVDDARIKLKAFPPVYRYYSNKVSEISKELDDRNGPNTVEGILSRNAADGSFITGTHRVPGAFTRPGYELMKTAIAEANEKLGEDDWVMGEAGRGDVTQSTDAGTMTEIYHRDYADHWLKFVKGVQISEFTNKADATAALQSFSSANSPIAILMREIATNTNLSAKPEAAGWIESITGFFSRGSTTETVATQTEREFRPLFSFVGTPEQTDKIPIETYQSILGGLHNDLSVLSDAQMKTVADQLAKEEDPRQLKLIEREKAVTGLLGAFNETTAGKSLVILLQAPIGNLRTLFGAGVKNQLTKAWTEEIVPAAQEIEKGYPFEDGAAEADLTKLTAFLNPADGRFSKFYDERLARYFEESGGQLKVKDTSEIQFSDEFIAYLNNAFKLRTALFGTNPTPKFEYEFTLRPVSGAIVEVTIDGQKITSEGTGSVKLSFPAGQSAETGVLVDLLSTGGSTPSGPGAFGQNANSNTSSGSSSSAPLTYQGNWGLFRFVDASNPQKQPGGEYALTFSVKGKTVNATIKPSGGDPFDKTLFRSVKAPQSFLK
jgi:type VI secretion system protein ImpL